MPNPKFFKKKGPYTIGKMAKILGCTVHGDENIEIFDIATLENASNGDISFLHNAKYIENMKATKASCCIIDPKNAELAPKHIALLITDDVHSAYAKIAKLFYEHDKGDTGFISERASIAKSAKIGKKVSISDFAFIGEFAEIGDNCQIGPSSYIGDGVTIGSNTTIHHGVTLSHCIVGDDCIIHSGTRIGQDGFGFAIGKNGIEKVLQLGSVIIGNNVEIGANTCIDRGTIEDTIVGDGTKIDNLVQLGHNVRIGTGCIIVSQVGIAGSTTIGDWAMVGGQAGIAGHISIGDRAKIAAKSGVMSDIAAGQSVGGIPATNIIEWHRVTATLRKMAKSGGTKND